MPKLTKLFRRERDPYWDAFINRAPADVRNLAAETARKMPGGRIYPIKSELHSPGVTSGLIKELAKLVDAEMCGIVALTFETDPVDPAASARPYAIVCALRTDYDPRESAGIGGQAPSLKGAFGTFVVASYIRELGYRASRAAVDYGDDLAHALGFGVLDSKGRLRESPRGAFIYVADVILTDLPLEPDTEMTLP